MFSSLFESLNKLTTPVYRGSQNELAYWRERILLWVLFIATVLGFFAYIAGLAHFIREGMWGLVAVDTVAYFTILFLFIFRRLPFILRAGSAVLILYILGIYLLYCFGFYGGGILWLFAFPVMTCVFLGIRAALAAFAITIVSMGAINYLAAKSLISWSFPDLDLSQRMISIEMDYILLCITATISLGLMMNRLQGALKDRKVTQKELEAESEERNQALEALRMSEKKYRLIAENMSDVISILDLNIRFTYVSPSIKRLTGLTEEAYISHSVEEVMPPEYFEKAMKAFEEEMMMEASGNADPHRTRILEFEQYTHDRSTIWVEASCSFLRDKEKNPVGLLIISRDISDRKQSEIERGRLLAAIEHSDDAIMVTDINGIIQYVNPAFQKISGYTWHEAINRNPRIWKSDRQDKLFYIQLWETILSGQTWSGRMVNKKKDGSLYTEDAKISPVFDASGQIIHFVAVKRDVTDHLRLSAQLQQSQKLESIGTLAGGIAHDFNNILSSIIGFTELALDDVEKGSSTEDSLQEIYTGGKRARDLVKQILAFARQSDEVMKPIQIGKIAKEVLKLLRATIPTTIRINQNIKKDLTIMGNATQVHQILMNICTNAAQAMDEDGGLLEISIQDTMIDSENTLDDLAPGEYAEIKISDTGVGIDAKIIDKIFDPYFTTKDTGKGTGMGLALVHGIIKSYNGMIKVESEPDQGTVFNVYFPLAHEVRESEVYQPEILPTGNERILLVDDEKPIVKMSSQILQKLGYDVVCHTSSKKALELFLSIPEDFDLVITDMTMPDMTGVKLAAELMSIRRDIPVILCTGYSNKISDKTAATFGIKAFAYKPVSKNDLAKTVRKVLDEAKS